MKNQTIKKDPNNRGHKELCEQLRTIWLGVKDANRYLLLCKMIV
jgi:hypothetical protein